MHEPSRIERRVSFWAGVATIIGTIIGVLASLGGYLSWPSRSPEGTEPIVTELTAIQEEGVEEKGGTPVESPSPPLQTEIAPHQETSTPPALVTGTTSSTSKPNSADPEKGPPVIQVSNGVEVSIRECKRSGRTVTCEGTLKNVTDAQLHVNFLPFGGVEIVDNLANRWKGTARFTLGGRDWELDIEPDLPVKFWIDKAEVAPDATSLTARITMGMRAGYDTERGRSFGGSSGQEDVVLRNIPLQ